MNINRRKQLSIVLAVCATFLLFAAVAAAATIDDDETGHFLRGTNSPDTINANGGDDTVRARKGADVVNGGDGNDRLSGGWGADQQHGGAGDDTIFANRGRDESWGDDGNDTLWALARGDVHSRYDVNGDTLHGGTGDDTFRTRDGEVDLIDCGEGNDTAILDRKDKILDATQANPNGSCETVHRKKRALDDHAEVVNP
jgi:Ca2+-binding RTX toxin-like protein